MTEDLKYRPRIADDILSDKLDAKGAVLIRGPKWCGKTTTAEQQAESVIYMSDPSSRSNNLALAKLDPQLLLAGATPRLIDEWQIAPQLWDAVRFEVDHRHRRGQFIMTGSAIPVNKKSDTPILHTGVGRFSIIDMLPMTLFESGDSSGEVRLRDLFDAPDNIRGINRHNLEEIAFLTCRGG